MTNGRAVAEAEAPAARPDAEPAKVPFWNRPHVEQFVIPLVLPVAVILFVVVFVLNISRLFLSGHEHIPVIVGTAITVLILVGATLLSSAASRLTKSFITLVAAVFLLSITGSGWLLVGHAQGESEGPATLAPELQTNETVQLTAAPSGQFAFAPNDIEGETGLIKFEVAAAAPGHSFAFLDPKTKLSAPINLDPGSTATGVGYFAEAGDYEFVCTIGTHAAQGMHGVVHVTGEPVPTVEDAIADAGN